MDTHKIAGISVNLETKGKIIEIQRKAYRIDKSEIADITIALSDKFIKQKQEENPNLTIDECEYIWTGISFYYRLLEFNGCMFHASAVAMDNNAYLFSAKSGTGKSTHTRLWQRYFGEDKALIINDDKPAIRFIDNQIYVYGTPWSGKSNKNLPMKVPLKGIVFIERSQANWISKVDNKEAIKLILDQTIRPKEIEKMDTLLGLIDTILKNVPVYKMGCDMSKEAVKLAYSTLNE